MKTFSQYFELRQNNSDHLYNWLERGKLSFDNIFGDAFRIVIPIVPEYLLNIKDKIENLSDAKNKIKVNLNNGTVEIQGTSGQGKPFTRTQRIAAYIQKIFGEEEKVNFDRSYKSSIEETNKFSIVLSRHPIDVARMSDAGALRSCHSQGETYFKCAMTEAQGHGPVAFLVETDDLEEVRDKIPTKEEIFEDDERDIEGIEPIGRIRLRRFIGPNFELAIPEIREYGKKLSGFYDSLKSFLKDKQKNLFGNDIPNMKEFDREGGSYEDNVSSELWNSFFDTDEFHGNTSYIGQDDYSSLADQYEEEAQEYAAQHDFDKNKIDFYYELLDDGEEPQLMWGGKVMFYFDKNLLNKTFYTDFDLDPRGSSVQKISSYDINGDEKMTNLISELDEVVDFDLQYISIILERNRLILELIFDNDRESFYGHPDEFNDFLNDIKYGIYAEYDEVQENIINKLMDMNYMTSPLHHFYQKFDKPFKNLYFYPRNNYVLVQSKEVPISPKIEDFYYMSDYIHRSLRDLIERVIDINYDNMIRNYLTKPLPGMNRELSEDDFGIADTKIDLEVDKGSSQITLTLVWELKKEDLDQPYYKMFLHYIDDRFDSVYQQIVSKVPIVLSSYFPKVYPNVKTPIKTPVKDQH